jgi:DNA-directed RNA polymerase beta' subunit
MFFMDVIPVSPTRFRPPAKLGDTLFEHPQNEMLTKVLNTTYRIRDLNTEIRSLPKDSVEARNKLFATELEALIQLQIDVNSFMDSSKNPTPLRQGKLPPAGVKQGLEKKEGLFRMHMMVCPRFLVFPLLGSTSFPLYLGKASQLRCSICYIAGCQYRD